MKYGWAIERKRIAAEASKLTLEQYYLRMLDLYAEHDLETDDDKDLVGGEDDNES